LGIVIIILVNYKNTALACLKYTYNVCIRFIFIC